MNVDDLSCALKKKKMWGGDRHASNMASGSFRLKKEWYPALPWATFD